MAILPFQSNQNRSSIPLLVLAAGLILTALASVFAFRAYDADENQRFDEAVEEIHGDLQARLDFFERCIRQMAATFAIDPTISQEEFSNYTYATGLRPTDPGLYSYGVFKHVHDKKAGKEKFVVWLREISPKLKIPVMPIGTDVSDNEPRMRLFTEAIETGRPVLATKVPSLTPNLDAGQMIAVASFEDGRVPENSKDRRQKVLGIAYARFSESGLFDQALQNASTFKSNLQVEIYDGEALSSNFTRPIFVHAAATALPNKLVRDAVSKITIGGRVFTVRVLSPYPFFRSTATFIAVLILAIGVAISLILFRSILQRERRGQRAGFLEDISKVLSTSLDPAVVAERLTQRLLTIGDWCVIELLDEQGETERYLYSASTPERYARLKDFYRDYPPAKTERRLTRLARETKLTQYLERVDQNSYGSVITDPRRLERLLQVGFESAIVTPLLSGDRVTGTMALYSGDAKRRFTPADVELVEEIAARSSIAFENARLYTESQNLNRAKDHFLAMLSHELRTPMNVILGWLEILTTEDVDDETYKQALDTLSRNANVQIQLINDLLDVSRIINGKLSLHAVPSRLGVITAGAIDSVQPAVRAKNIQCTLETDGDLTCTLDPERIQQVLWNLLSNAAKFTPHGGRISVKVSGSTDEVRMMITDSGQGIEPSFLPFVFDRFRQEEAGFTRSQGGLGLGLSIVRYIVEGHGGTISVTSQGRNQGTTFTVVLPRVAQISEDRGHLAVDAF